jgi:hypothetical protein
MKNKAIIFPGMEIKAVRKQVWKDAYIPDTLKIKVVFNKNGDPVIREKRK